MLEGMRTEKKGSQHSPGRTNPSHLVQLGPSAALGPARLEFWAGELGYWTLGAGDRDFPVLSQNFAQSWPQRDQGLPSNSSFMQS